MVIYFFSIPIFASHANQSLFSLMTSYAVDYYTHETNFWKCEINKPNSYLSRVPYNPTRILFWNPFKLPRDFEKVLREFA